MNLLQRRLHPLSNMLGLLEVLRVLQLRRARLSLYLPRIKLRATPGLGRRTTRMFLYSMTLPLRTMVLQLRIRKIRLLPDLRVSTPLHRKVIASVKAGLDPTDLKLRTREFRLLADPHASVHPRTTPLDPVMILCNATSVRHDLITHQHPAVSREWIHLHFSIRRLLQAATL
ncbi:hypothetical protein BDV96DRAFT_266375 [Lophiotrema nucula]|uniref:Uncharacterized protein n=1 Tax=Lophiotrema nucula TaxID=690887 RepID=A0A6A5ZQ98_9PLEO|nr:hypothetical protein BDV96DRAFT_266375 [Lophiotrema nucula]